MSASSENEYAEAFRRGYERARRGFEATVRLDEADAGDEGPDESPEDWVEDTSEHRLGGFRFAEHEPAAREAAGRRRRHEPTGQEPARRRRRRHEPTGQEPAGRRRGRQEPGPLSAPEHVPGLVPHVPPDRPSYDVLAPAPTPAPTPWDAGRRQAKPVRQRTLVAGLGLAVLCLVLVLGAFGLGRLLADDGSSSEEDLGGAPTAGGGMQQEAAAPYEGPVRAVDVGGSSATCQASSSVDAAGNSVTYEPARAHDSDLSTAWRCPGSGRGERFTVSLSEATVVAEVGLVPGYAKTDPVSGVDRYAENNRLTRVRWTFDDGSAFVQTMDGGAADRSLRTMRIPETSTATVVIEILGSQRGPRRSVAISEIRIGAPAAG